jgi:tRNA modification GTPase
MKDTICAISTGAGGAIGIIRVSGPDAITITNRLFSKALMDVPAQSIHYGNIIDEEGCVIDAALVSIFRAPHSYTGENSTEISCHGSKYILNRVIRLLIDNGCRQAEPGEYTQRAFLNGKLDLSQAEAVADLIASSNRATHLLAMNQMRGGFSSELDKLRDKIIHLTSLLELELDFSDHEDLEFADRSELRRLAQDLYDELNKLTNSFRLGNAIKNGLPVAIVGNTNTGKSTLLNALLNEERSIVSDIQGTTRDAIEDTLNIGDITLRFIDTAGIRHTSDKIESMGISRSLKKLQQAYIVLWVLDARSAESDIAQLSSQILPECQNKHLILILNKSDITKHPHPTKLTELLYNYIQASSGESINKPSSIDTIEMSAKNRTNLEVLVSLLKKYTHLSAIDDNTIIITNQRHYEALYHAQQSIERVKESLSLNLSGDLISEDLHICIDYLSNITGRISSQDVLNNIFSNFCVGK